MGNPFTTIETLIRSLVQAVNAATATVSAAYPLPAASTSNELQIPRVNSAGTAYELRTPAEVRGDIDAAALAGSASQVFEVANGAEGNDAVNYQQMSGATASNIKGASGTAANTNYDFSHTFTVPNKSFLSAVASWNDNSQTSVGGYTQAILLDGSVISYDLAGAPSWVTSGVSALTAGNHTVTFRVGVGSAALSGTVNVRGIAIVSPSP